MRETIHVFIPVASSTKSAQILQACTCTLQASVRSVPEQPSRLRRPRRGPPWTPLKAKCKPSRSATSTPHSKRESERPTNTNSSVVAQQGTIIEACIGQSGQFALRAVSAHSCAVPSLCCYTTLSVSVKLTLLQAGFEAAQQPPVHHTKPGMKALKVLPGQLSHPALLQLQVHPGTVFICPCM